MPWSPKQNRLFRAIEHDPKWGRDHGFKISQKDATRMAHEGVRKSAGGLARYAAGGGVYQPLTPTYGPTGPQDPSFFHNDSLAAIEAGLTPQYASGGSVQDQNAQFGPRAAAIMRLNDQISQSNNPMPGRVPGAMTSRLSALRSPMLSAYSPQFSRSLDPTLTPSGAYGRGYAIGGMVRPGEFDPDWAIQHQFDRDVGFYADGGQTEESASMGGAEGLAALLLALKRRHINSLARPITRALSKPVLGIEAVSKVPLSESVSDARYNLAREATHDPLSRLPVTRGQGAWEGDNGMEFNPLYMQELPRTLGALGKDRRSMRYASQMGENLEQVATPVSRFVPHLMNTPEDANAMQFSGVNNEMLKAIAQRAGSNWVTAHRPGNKAMMFPLGDDKLEEMARKLVGEGLATPPRYGRSDPVLDRVLLSREPLGYEDALYSDHGAIPRDEAYRILEEAMLRRPQVRRGTSWLNDMGRGAK